MVNFTAASITSDITYGLGLLGSFGAKVDVVGIYNGALQGPVQPPSASSNIINSLLGQSNTSAAFGQLFVNARPLKATVRETSKIMEHPLETGVMLQDHHIINPVEIDIPLVVPSQYYASTYSQMRQAFINAALLNVKTRTGVYQNMVIANMPHEEDAEMYDAITIALHLKQAQFIVPGTGTLATSYQPLNPVNSNTVASGLQQGVALAGKLLTTATSVSSYLTVFKRKLL